MSQPNTNALFERSITLPDSDARDRLRCFQVAPVLFVLPKIRAEIGLDQPRRDGIDADAMRAELARQTTKPVRKRAK